MFLPNCNKNNNIFQINYDNADNDENFLQENQKKFYDFYDDSMDVELIKSEKFIVLKYTLINYNKFGNTFDVENIINELMKEDLDMEELIFMTKLKDYLFCKKKIDKKIFDSLQNILEIYYIC